MIKNTFGVLICLLIINCNSSRVQEKNAWSTNYNIYKLISSFPNLDSSGNLEYIRDSIYSSRYENKILFLIPTLNYKIINNAVETESSFSFFEFEETKKTGIYRQSLFDSIGRTYSVDTFLMENVYSTVDLSDIIKKTELLRVDSVSAKILSKVYYSKIIPDETYNDTTYLTFSKDRREVDFPFCRELDSIHGLSLIKAVFIFNEKYLPANNIKLPRRQMLFEIVKDESVNPIMESFIKKRTNGK
jgi:hypothetical protein